MDTRGGAKAEARSLLPLLASGISAEEISRDIQGHGKCNPATNAFRAEVQREFDRLVRRLNPVELSRGRIKFSRPVNPIMLTRRLEAEILKRLANQTTEHVAHALRIPITPVRKVSRKYGISFQRKGRGRRYSAATIKAMTAQLRSGARPTDVAKRFGCTLELTKRIRNEFGDRLDRRRVNKRIRLRVKRGLTAGERPSEVERALNLTHSWLWHFRRTVLNDSRDLRRDPKKIPADEARLIAEALRAGKPVRVVARQFHHGYRQVKEIGFAVGWRPRKCRKFTPAERALILKLIAEGKTNAEVAQTLRCSITVIQQARRKSRWTKESETWKTAAA